MTKEYGSMSTMVFGIKIGRWVLGISRVDETFTTFTDMINGILKVFNNGHEKLENGTACKRCLLAQNYWSRWRCTYADKPVPHPLPPIERSRV